MSDYIDASGLVFPAGVSVGTNTAPYTLNGVGSVIAQIGAEVDGLAAAAGYEVPISTVATIAYAIVQRAVTNGVYGIVMDTLFDNMTGGAPARTSSYSAAYAQFKKDLKSGDLDLVGAAKAGTDQGRVLATGGRLASAPITMRTQF